MIVSDVIFLSIKGVDNPEQKKYKNCKERPSSSYSEKSISLARKKFQKYSKV